MSNPYANFTIEDFKDSDLVYEAMSEYVNTISNGSGDWSWSDFSKYVDMQSVFIDERLQELACCNCGNDRCGLEGICELGAELEEQVHQLYKDLGI